MHSITRRRLSALVMMMTMLLILSACNGGTSNDTISVENTASSNVLQATTPASDRASPPSDSGTPSTALAGEPTDETGAAQPTGDLFIENPETTPFVKPTGGPTIAPTVPPDTPYLSAQLDKDGDGFVTDEELYEAIRQSMDRFEWPDGYLVTADLIIDNMGRGIPGMANQTEVGGEYGIIGGYHLCAWYMAWLDAYVAGDAAAEAEALDIMTNDIPANPMFYAMRDTLEEVAGRAALGDPSMVQSFVENDCRRLPIERVDGSGTATPGAARTEAA